MTSKRNLLVVALSLALPIYAKTTLAADPHKKHGDDLTKAIELSKRTAEGDEKNRADLDLAIHASLLERQHTPHPGQAKPAAAPLPPAASTPQQHWHDKRKRDDDMEQAIELSKQSAAKKEQADLKKAIEASQQEQGQIIKRARQKTPLAPPMPSSLASTPKLPLAPPMPSSSSVFTPGLSPTPPKPRDAARSKLVMVKSKPAPQNPRTSGFSWNGHKCTIINRGQGKCNSCLMAAILPQLQRLEIEEVYRLAGKPMPKNFKATDANHIEDFRAAFTSAYEAQKDRLTIQGVPAKIRLQSCDGVIEMPDPNDRQPIQRLSAFAKPERAGTQMDSNNLGLLTAFVSPVRNRSFYLANINDITQHKNKIEGHNASNFVIRDIHGEILFNGDHASKDIRTGIRLVQEGGARSGHYLEASIHPVPPSASSSSQTASSSSPSSAPQ